METESCASDEKADVSKSKESGAIEQDEAFHVVGQLLDSLLSDMLTKRTDVKDKKRPSRFTAEQKEVLEKTFAVDQFVKGARMATLRQEVGLSKEQVSKWFMQRRALERKKKKVESSTVTVIANVSKVTTTEGAGKDKKKRTLFTAQQTQKLESAFAEEQFIRGARLASLVQEVGLSKVQVSRWFMFRRALEWRRKNVRVDVQESFTVSQKVSSAEEAAVVKRSDVAADKGDESLKMKSKLSLTDPQKAGLEKAFAEERFLGKEREVRLAEDTGLSVAQVSRWFCNHRAKMREEAFVGGKVEEKKDLPKWSLTVEQRSELEKAFTEGPFIGKTRMARLTEDLGLREKQVSRWFNNQRAKMRKEAAAEGEVKGDKYSPETKFIRSFTIVQREELEKAFAENEKIKGKDMAKLAENLQLDKKQVRRWFRNERKRKGGKVVELAASSQVALLESPKLKLSLVQEKKGSLKIRQQGGEVKEASGHYQLVSVQETAANANVAKGAGRKRATEFEGEGRWYSKRNSLTTLQAAGLAEAFAKEEYIVGGKLSRLAEDLGMSKKQVITWFSSKRLLKRKKEEAAIGKLVDGVEVWPQPDHHLPEEVAAADSTKVARGVDLKGEVVSAKENVLVTSLEEDIGQVERKVEEVMASVAVPLLSLPLSHQEMLLCLDRLNSAPWSFGSKAALLLVVTDQVKLTN